MTDTFDAISQWMRAVNAPTAEELRAERAACHEAAALVAGLDAVERATDVAGDLGTDLRHRVDAEHRATDALLDEYRRRLQLATDAALAAHEQAAAARAALGRSAALVHTLLKHAGEWITCDSETCRQHQADHAATLAYPPAPRLPAPEEMVELLAGSLLCRAGEVITPEVASERARNAACWVLLLIDGLHELAQDVAATEAQTDDAERSLQALAAAARSLLAEMRGGK